MKNLILNYLIKKNRTLVNYNYPSKKPIFKLIKSLGSRLCLRYGEAYQLHTIVRDVCSKQSGNLAEVGCFQGGSTMLISKAKGNNPLYVFDTFEGLPVIDDIDKSKNKWECNFEEGEYASDYKDVKNFLKEESNINIYKGIFPQTNSDKISDKTFIFVHLDVDIYSSTLDSLKFFYPRMKSGGVILTHDYSTAKGVKKAFDEFFEDKPESVFELQDTYGMVIIK